MTTTFGLPRWLLLWALVLPLAVLIGYLIAVPLAFSSLILLGAISCVLLFPLFLRWHHAWVIFTWNAALITFFLPGQPKLGYVVAAASLAVSILHRTLRHEKRFIQVPAVTRPLVFIAIVVAVTSVVTGGIGGRALGSEAWGAKRYLGVFAAIIGYFALTAQIIPREKVARYAGWFILSGLTAAGSDMVYAAGSGFYALFALFPVNLAASQATTEGTLYRLSGLAFAAQSVCFYLVLKYGLLGLLNLRRPWRMTTFVVFAILSLFGGFRSLLIILIIVLSVQFILEGLYKTHWGIMVVLAFALLGIGLVSLSDKLPLSVQRSLSFLPLKIDPTARRDAAGTLQWRIDMWKVVMPEVPQYLLFGKGFAFSGTDYYLTQEAQRRGIYLAYEDTLVSGNYHNGILTLIIPFGIWGVIGFIWFCWGALHVLYRNFRFGEVSLKHINTFLFGFFLSRLTFYILFYGQFDLDLPLFTGVVGISIAVNNGVRSPEPIT